jgi:hypothetical protein
MPLYQNSTVSKVDLVLGNYKIEVATYGTTIGGTFVNLGAGIVNSFGHELSKYDVQAGNAPDPIEGVADETFPVTGELIEYRATSMSLIFDGILTATSTASGITTLTGGGKTEMTNYAIRLTNTRMYPTGGTTITATTVLYLPKATATAGLSWTAKSDNDTDPINVIAFAIEGKIDSTATVGSQLFTIRRGIGA